MLTYADAGDDVADSQKVSIFNINDGVYCADVIDYTCVLILTICAPRNTCIDPVTSRKTPPLLFQGPKYVSSCYYMYHNTIYVSSYCANRKHPPPVLHICVLILLYVCRHTTIYVLTYYCMCPHTGTPAQTTSRMTHPPVPVLLYMCAHTTAYVSSYYNICVC